MQEQKQEDRLGVFRINPDVWLRSYSEDGKNETNSGHTLKGRISWIYDKLYVECQRMKRQG